MNLVQRVGVPGPSVIKPDVLQLNGSLYELYKPPSTRSMYVVFLHGLQSEDNTDPHLSTWKCGDGSCWPQTWLIEEFPRAHVFSAAYTAIVKKNHQGGLDMHNTAENLLSDIVQGSIGQSPYCPVILVGHCFGGLVIKELCIRAFETRNLASGQKQVQLAKFLGNIRGIFYYGTPHHGSPVMNKKLDHLGSDLLKYFKILSTESARLNEKFEKLRGLYPKWRIHGLGESKITASGFFQGFVGAPEATSRAGDSFNVMELDHIQISRPRTRTQRNFYGLIQLLASVVKDVEEEETQAKAEEAQAIAKSRRLNLQYLPKEIVGIDVLIQAVKTQLVESTTLGLVGMGGCGKTTLAKAIFNDLVMGFEYSSFVREVKLTAGSEDDVKKKIWSQMHHFGEEMATKPQWSLLQGKRLLLILDDVSSNRDLDVLFDIARHLDPGSRCIVTSRDRDLLKRLDASHEVPFLNDSIAKDAFPKQGAAPSQLERLVNAIVKKCDGLPLAIEVLGRYLQNTDEEEEWIQTLDALGKAETVTGLNEKLWEKLKLSFDGLQENEKQIFLDAATFFCSNDAFTLGEAKIAWEAAYERASVSLLWRTLVDRSLVYDVQEDEKIQMHEQLLTLGRRIGANENRWIWGSREAWKWQSPGETHHKNVFALKLDMTEPTSRIRISKNFLMESLKAVRYLEVRGVVVDGERKIADDKDVVVPSLTNLLVAKFTGVQKNFFKVLHDSTQLTRLVILCLSHMTYIPKSVSHWCALKVLKLVECPIWSLPVDIGYLQQLQVVHISHCYRLNDLRQSFGNLSALNRLVLSHCPSLRFLPESFGNLPKLSTVWFHHCESLCSLPESFGRLSAMKRLQFKHCSMLETIPESFGDLPELRTVSFDHCPELEALPKSFGKLRKLSSLRLEYCQRLQTLPESFGNLPELSNLQFLRCYELHTLPESFGLLSKLSSLQFKYCQNLQTLPESFGKLSALSSFELRCYSLQALPDSFGNLSALSDLQIQDCGKLHTLPESFGLLPELSNLRFKNCHGLRTLPESFGRLLKLSNLQLETCSSLRTLPESFGKLTKLEDLKISGCLKLDILPESFAELSALRQLSIERVGLKTVPDCIRSLRSLQVLEIGCLPFVMKLPPGLGEAEAGLQITSIKLFNVQGGKFTLVTEHNLTDDVLQNVMEELQPNEIKAHKIPKIS